MDYRTYFRDYPDKNGRFGEYGGVYLPPQLVPVFEEITKAYNSICHSAKFINELRRIRKEFQGRPTPVYHCERLSRLIGTSPMVLWHGLCAAPASVTTVYTEERRRGIASFRINSFGDTGHLYAAGEAPSFSARFCETYDNAEERHD